MSNFFTIENCTAELLPHKRIRLTFPDGKTMIVSPTKQIPDYIEVHTREEYKRFYIEEEMNDDR